MQMPREIGTFHIIGIGGIGMSAIAEILLAKGYSVQGSDQKDSANVRRLRAKGVRVFIGHDAINLVGARSVVISTAVGSPTPECSCSGIITENSPPSVEVCAFPRSASRIVSRSPSSVFPSVSSRSLLESRSP